MPASRSRTENWKSYLHKICDRNGAMEISVHRQISDADGAPGDGGWGSDLIWRVRVVEVTDSTIVVDPPAALGHAMAFDDGIELIGALCIGQNRWMFHTRTVGYRDGPGGDRQLVLQMPEGVERCSRRHTHRMTTADLSLPRVQCWPLYDPTSVIAAETANRLQLLGTDSLPENTSLITDPDSILLPNVGTMFEGRLVNISGGGLGVSVGKEDAVSVSHRPFLWLRVDLRPQIRFPVAVTARVAHTHLESGQNLYAGLAFDFTHNPDHRAFVVQLLSDYVRQLQMEQRSRRTA